MRLYQHDSPATFQMILKGALGDEAAQNVRWAWHTASSIVGRKELVVDVSDVTVVHPEGVELLRCMRENGARIAAASPLRCEALSELLDRPAPTPRRDHLIRRALRFIYGLRSRDLSRPQCAAE